MAKKMSVEEILAAARGGSAKKPADAPPAAPPSEAAPPAEASAPVAEESAPSASEAAPVKPVKTAGMSVADILAAAKAGKSAPKPAAAAAPAAKPAAAAPAAEKKAPPKTDAATAAAVPKDTASILAAARKGSKPGPVSKAEAEKKGIIAPPTKKKLEAPPMPAKPDFARPAPVAATAADPSRRTFMAAMGGALFGSSLAIGFTSLAVTHVMWGLGLARFMFPNILIEPPTKFKVGPPANFGPGQVETKFIPEFGVWIVRYEFEGRPMIYALKSVCTHLGCTPNWLEAEQKFKCPCHGSGFYKDGVNFEGPAPRPLERYAISLADDGQLEVDKSRTFNQEQGQWKDTASFVPV
jgi:cytochrome b6-f complex iron-sulfur subunit